MAPAALRSAFDAKRQRMAQNIADRGGRLVLSQLIVVVVCALVVAVSHVANEEIDEGACSTSPVVLRSWFRGLFVAHAVAGVVFLLIAGIVFSVLPTTPRPEPRAAPQVTQASQPPGVETAAEPTAPQVSPSSPAERAPSSEPPAVSSPASAPEAIEFAPSGRDALFELVLARGSARMMFLFALSIVVVADIFFLLIWDIMGLVAAIGAEMDDGMRDECREGLLFFWLLAIGAFFNACFKLCSTLATHSGPQPRPPIITVGSGASADLPGEATAAS
mmetsp:Transcript_46184/g.134455  ORF Transcript_46184/g.134455 Transcript_46184/m.134455 type:complete len:276 (+) Transcript_46184:81-908(+)|eukprot:CAMPEP_0170229222 /NCGR_PEP_ID=MMETSP0116_2-20130129/14334_1 /TAXON_ID=400756 /ORGANISM="Durinskia baltica, Strain CSIRO CS-38" /LENGTH=275 /DNA_ID=CAMNT_0010479971 /DNA_START=72 /DNA_END=899 /DNA_ORIENTATION=+